MLPALIADIPRRMDGWGLLAPVVHADAEPALRRLAVALDDAMRYLPGAPGGPDARFRIPRAWHEDARNIAVEARVAWERAGRSGLSAHNAKGPLVRFVAEALRFRGKASSSHATIASILGATGCRRVTGPRLWLGACAATVSR
jgi:hypothetical protein